MANRFLSQKQMCSNGYSESITNSIRNRKHLTRNPIECQKLLKAHNKNIVQLSTNP